MLYTYNKAFSKRLYLKEIPVTFNYQTIKRASIVGQFFGIVLLTAVITFIFLSNITPFGITNIYDMNTKNINITQLSPNKRVMITKVNGQQMYKVIDDLIYFTTNMPFNFDTATVKVWFQNPSLDQTFSIGFQDQPIWHYNIRAFDAPFLNSLNWIRNGYNPVLYQKQQVYNSADDFLANPPHNAIIGTYKYDSDIGNPHVTIPNYKPSARETVINTSLRGRQTIYVYLDHEPFHMTIKKQDLNWYVIPDTVKVTVYKDNDVVYQTSVADDGITDGSRKVLPPANITINNNGQGMPESGLYKIVIDANTDTIIKSIKTNLHKIVFANSIFPVANNNVYNGIVASTSSTIVYTNALLLSAVTYHPAGEQIITVGNKQLILNELQIPVNITPPDNLTKVFIPQNDVMLNGFQGFFSFTPDEFFMPSNYYLMPVNSISDTNMVDYIVTNYLPSHKENGWQVNEQTFELDSAYIKNNKLSWVLEAPQLKENGNTLNIRNIQVTFHKKGLLQ